MPGPLKTISGTQRPASTRNSSPGDPRRGDANRLRPVSCPCPSLFYAMDCNVMSRFSRSMAAPKDRAWSQRSEPEPSARAPLTAATRARRDARPLACLPAPTSLQGAGSAILSPYLSGRHLPEVVPPCPSGYGQAHLPARMLFPNKRKRQAPRERRSVTGARARGPAGSSSREAEPMAKRPRRMAERPRPGLAPAVACRRPEARRRCRPPGAANPPGPGRCGDGSSGQGRFFPLKALGMTRCVHLSLRRRRRRL